MQICCFKFPHEVSHHPPWQLGVHVLFAGKFHNEPEVEGKCFNCKKSASVPGTSTVLAFQHHFRYNLSSFESFFQNCTSPWLWIQSLHMAGRYYSPGDIPMTFILGVVARQKKNRWRNQTFAFARDKSHFFSCEKNIGGIPSCYDFI